MLIYLIYCFRQGKTIKLGRFTFMSPCLFCLSLHETEISLPPVPPFLSLSIARPERRLPYSDYDCGFEFEVGFSFTPASWKIRSPVSSRPLLASLSAPRLISQAGARRASRRTPGRASGYRRRSPRARPPCSGLRGRSGRQAPRTGKAAAAAAGRHERASDCRRRGRARLLPGPFPLGSPLARAQARPAAPFPPSFFPVSLSPSLAPAGRGRRLLLLAALPAARRPFPSRRGGRERGREADRPSLPRFPRPRLPPTHPPLSWPPCAPCPPQPLAVVPRPVPSAAPQSPALPLGAA